MADGTEYAVLGRKSMQDIEKQIEAISTDRQRQPVPVVYEKETGAAPSGQEYGRLTDTAMKYFKSGIVTFGLVGLLSFGAGMKYRNNVSQSYNAAKQYAGQVVTGIGKKIFNALPADKKNEILLENASKISPAELMKQLEKAKK